MSFDPERPDLWTGDPAELRGHEDRLTADPELCERLFGSKAEAFGVGISLGETLMTSEGRTG